MVTWSFKKHARMTKVHTINQGQFVQEINAEFVHLHIEGRHKGEPHSKSRRSSSFCLALKFFIEHEHCSQSKSCGG